MKWFVATSHALRDLTFGFTFGGVLVHNGTQQPAAKCRIITVDAVAVHGVQVDV